MFLVFKETYLLGWIKWNRDNAIYKRHRNLQWSQEKKWHWQKYDFLAPIFAAASIQRRRHFYEFFCTQRWKPLVSSRQEVSGSIHTIWQTFIVSDTKFHQHIIWKKNMKTLAQLVPTSWLKTEQRQRMVSRFEKRFMSECFFCRVKSYKWFFVSLIPLFNLS